MAINTINVLTLKVTELNAKLDNLNKQLKDEHSQTDRLKTFSNAFNNNDIETFINSLPNGIKGTCARIFIHWEGKVLANKSEVDKDYMVVYESQQQTATALNLTREYICHCINIMAKAPNCIFEKIRQGLNKANYYILTGKKNLQILLNRINEIKEEVKKTIREIENEGKDRTVPKRSWTNKFEKIDTFNNYDQRSYDYNELEKNLLGWD